MVGQTVGQRHADAIAAPDAGGGQRFGDGLDLIPQLAVADADVLLGKDDGRLVGRNRPQQAEQRRWGGR